MRKEHTLTKISLGIDIITVFVLLVYFVVIAPRPPITNNGGILILLPPVFGIFGLITAVLGRKKNKTTLGRALIIVNIFFLCWCPIVWFGGTLLLGV